MRRFIRSHPGKSILIAIILAGGLFFATLGIIYAVTDTPYPTIRCSSPPPVEGPTVC